MQVRWMAVLSVGGLLLVGSAGDLAWAQASPPLDYFSVSPCRLLDTRLPAQGPALASGASRLVTVTGSCGVPASARAIAANITSVAPTGLGNLRLYPGDGTVPTTSSLNFGAGQTRANNGVFALAGNGNGTLAMLATVSGNGSVDVVLDVTGYFASSAPPPPGDTCQVAVPLGFGAETGNTTGKANDFEACVSGGGGTFPGPDMVYTFMVPAGRTFAVTVQPSSPWDVALIVLTNCSAGACSSATDAGGDGVLETTMVTNFTATLQTVFAIVDSATAAEAGLFTISAQLLP